MKWVAWKLVVRDKVTWMTRPEYRFDTREEAEKLAESFKRQLSVVDIAVLPMGEYPEPSEIAKNRIS